MTVTHIALGGDAGVHFRLYPDGFWYRHQAGVSEGIRVTVSETTDLLDAVGSLGIDPNQSTLFGDES